MLVSYKRRKIWLKLRQSFLGTYYSIYLLIHSFPSVFLRVLAWVANGVEYYRNIEYRGSQSQSGKDLFFYLNGLNVEKDLYFLLSDGRIERQQFSGWTVFTLHDNTLSTIIICILGLEHITGSDWKWNNLAVLVKYDPGPTLTDM